jgi:Zn-dependent M28 family amino/carboxypeptidase
MAMAAGQAAQTAATPRVDVDRLIADVRTLSDRGLEGRQTGSEGNRRARAFILHRFRELELQPVAGTHEQKFPFTTRSKGANVPTANTSVLQGTNLMGMIRGSAEPDRFVLIGAHFDHLGRKGHEIYPGADDNASGVAGMLAAASWFAHHPPQRSVVFVAFDAEEEGLQGARHFVKDPPLDLTKIVAMVNLDMIGRGDANTLWAAGTHHYPALKPPVVEAARSRTIEVMFGHDRPKAEAGGMADWTNSSDHGPFHVVGVPFLYFGVEDHPDYHKPTDTADRIPRAFFAEAVTLVIDVIERLASSLFLLTSSF